MQENEKSVAMMEEDVQNAAPSSLWRDALERFKRNKTAVFAFFMLLLLILAAIVGPFLTKYDPIETNLAEIRALPSAEHILGCDEQGRDILTRLMYGARISLTIGTLASLVSTLIGSFIGLMAAYYGGNVDIVVSRFMEMLSAFPGILLAIVLMSAFGRGVANAMLAIAIGGIPGPFRIVRSATLSAKETDYVGAARAIGCSNLRIMVKHILPNILAPIIVNATMSISGGVMSLSGLGFLGLGVQPPTAEWGYMLSAGRKYIFAFPHLVISPGVAIALTVLSFNLLGDGLRDALDPRLK